MLEITNKAKLENYLIQQGILKNEDQIGVEYLVGGVSGHVARVQTANQVFVVKQILAKLKVKDEWYSDPKRLCTEIDCLRVYNNLVPNSVPKLLFVDEDNHLFGMESAPLQAEMWKNDLMKGQINTSIALKIVESLAQVHNLTYKNNEMQDRFSGTDIFVQLRINPYFGKISEKHPLLKKEIQQMSECLLNTKKALVHGDFSPKNILTYEDKIIILDFEVAHYGEPLFDLAFLINHLFLKSIYNKKFTSEYLELINTMLTRYYELVTFDSKRHQEALCTRIFALLFLSRVDGKSPVEYMTDEQGKEMVRKISYMIIKDNIDNFNDVQQMIRNGY